MRAHVLSDEGILDILEKDSQRGIILLMEKYTALIWHVSSLHVKNPEDIKECVNDTFSEFYFHRNRFNPEKASLPVYLTAIARNKAISCYRKEQREKNRRVVSRTEELAGDEPQIAKAELRTDMQRAMSLLKPNELQIIRMKYYDGMSVREIADSLKLPYEMVKKRHQRSVQKLRKSLILVFALVFFLTACVYGVLRYLEVIPSIGSWPWPWTWEKANEPEEEPEDDIGIKEVPELRLRDTKEEQRETEQGVDSAGAEDNEEISFSLSPTALTTEAEKETVDAAPTVMEEYTVSPGYGINIDPNEPVYTLAEKATVENEKYGLTIEEAYYINHRITATIRFFIKNDTAENWEKLAEGISVNSISFQELVWRQTYVASRNIDSYSMLVVCCFDNVSFPDMKKGIENISILFNSGDSISFGMVSVEQEKITAYPYQTGELGGILAIPRFEADSLIIAIHPLDDGDELQIVPAIVVDSASSGPEELITITGKDGEIYAGECIRYHPFGEETYFEWDFGKVKPGSYTLNIPWVYMKAEMNEINMSMNLLKNSWEQKKYPIPGGSIWIQDCVPIDEKPEELPEQLWTAASTVIKNWRISLGYDSVYPRCSVTGFYGLLCEMETYPPDIGMGADQDMDYFVREYNMTMFSNDIENGVLEYVLEVNLELANPENTNIYSSKKGTINFRWNQSFEIPFTVE